MKPGNSPWRPAPAASLTWREDGAPVSAVFGDVYYSRDNGLEESRHVFLEGNRLPGRWRGHARDVFTVGETGFGTGLNFLLTWQAWRESPLPRPRLHFLSIEQFPLSRQNLVRALTAWSGLAPLAEQLVEQYPGLVPGQHRLLFERGGVTLDLWWCDVAEALTDIAGQQRALVDAWYLDGFAPARNQAMWSQDVLHGLAQLSREGASVSTFTAAGQVRRGLVDAGFDVCKVPGFGRKRECLRGELRQRPPWVEPSATPWDLTDHRGRTAATALVIGAGLAGCTAAEALARRGIRVTLLDRGPLAGAGSGNEQGVLYTRLSRKHSPLTDFALQSFRYASDFYAGLFRSGRLVEGRDGELCGSFHPCRDEVELAAMAELLAAVPELAQVADREAADRLCGIRQAAAGYWFPRSGWLSPAAVCRALADHEGIRLLPDCGELSLAPSGSGWSALQDGQLLVEADCAIIAAGTGSALLNGLEWLPLQSIRGQTTQLPGNERTRSLATTFCHEGYIAPAKAGEHCIGATFDIGDEDARPRQQDNRENLERLAGAVPAWRDMLLAVDPAKLSGRVGFRCASPDYLPLAGPVPDRDAFLHAFGELRKNARRIIDQKGRYMQGLYLSTGHGSRGLTSTPLAAEALASSICGEPPPFERALCRALSPARFLVRDLARGRI